MLNKKALEAAGNVVVLLDAMTGATSTMARMFGEKDLSKAIEAYLAALPDEDGLVLEARCEAGRMRVFSGNIPAAIWLERLADALEAARAAAPEPGDPSGHE